MSRVYCEELITTLTQEINFVSRRRYHIPAISLGIVMYNAPSGTFTLSVMDGSIVLTSKSFTSADIKTDLSTSNNYGYIYKTLQFTSELILEYGSYDFVLSSSGYTYSSNSFIGWIKPPSDVFNTEANSDSLYLNNPLDILIYDTKFGG
jgi:hypothetical protein